jgi:uncharacterized membrane protein YvlD (DUF360 family)
MNVIRRVSNWAGYKVFGVPLYIGIFGGIISVLIDLDHPITYWLKGTNLRAAHIPLAIISCIILCSVSTCIGGLFLGMVLRRKRDKDKY